MEKKTEREFKKRRKRWHLGMLRNGGGRWSRLEKNGRQVERQ